MDLSRALSYAAHLDSAITELRSEPRLRRIAAYYSDIYPTYDLIKGIIEAVGDLHRGSGDIECKTVSVIRRAAYHKMISVSDATMFVGAAHRLAERGVDCAFLPDFVDPERCGVMDGSGKCHPMFFSADYLLPSMDDMSVIINPED